MNCGRIVLQDNYHLLPRISVSVLRQPLLNACERFREAPNVRKSVPFAIAYRNIRNISGLFSRKGIRNFLADFIARLLVGS